MRLLVTGGAGYIGSHTCVELLNQGFHVVIIDNLSNSNRGVCRNIEEISGKTIDAFYEADIADRRVLQEIFREHDIDVVMHFAGLKSVSESVGNPLKYYDNNVAGTLVLLEEMNKVEVKSIVFSSSATVYGVPNKFPVSEESPTGNTETPYGKTKYFVEEILKHLYDADADSEWSIALLRYFNPVGAHPSSKIGENPNGVPANLMPYICQVASGELEQLSIYGKDYPTSDGTGVRDYIHVVDLAKGHIAALDFARAKQLLIVNLGTGNGVSVLEMVHAFERASGKKINYKIESRRCGDVAECWASTDYAFKKLRWKAEHGVEQMCKDAWNWQLTLHDRD